MQFEPTLKDAGIYIVGIGYKGAQGKDTFARCVQDSDPAAIAVFSMGMDIIAPVARWLGLMDEKNPAVMQSLAETWLKTDPYHLIRIMQRVILDTKPVVALMTSLRCNQEIEWIKANGGIIVEVKRMLPNGAQYVCPNRNPNHWSEKTLENTHFDYTITCDDGNLEQLAADASEFYRHILLNRVS